MALRNGLKYALGLAVAAFASDIKSKNKEYHFSPLVQREEIILPVPEIMNLYFDCDQKFYNSGRFRLRRTEEEIKNTVQKRLDLEEKLTRYYNEQGALSHLTFHPIDTTSGWYDPLDGKGELRDNFNDPRSRPGRRTEKHKANDLFAPRDTYIRAPLSGVVIAAADDWKGSWNRKQGLHNTGGGLGDIAGNGALFFIPQGLFGSMGPTYIYVVHMDKVYAHTGDVVSRGDFIGTIGKTGNAISPRIKDHSHMAIKEEGEACGIKGPLVARNPFWILLANRNNNQNVSVEESFN